MSFQIPPMPADTPPELKVYFNAVFVEVQATINELELQVQELDARVKTLEAAP